MKVNQLSIFLENKPGHLSEPCRILAEAGINILTISLADTQQFGILRLIVKEWERAQAALEKAGCVVNITEVVAIEVQDKPSGLEDILRIMDEMEINVEYMYAFTFRKDGKAIIVFRFENTDETLKKLETQNIRILSNQQVCDLVD